MKIHIGRQQRENLNTWFETTQKGRQRKYTLRAQTNKEKIYTWFQKRIDSRQQIYTHTNCLKYTQTDRENIPPYTWYQNTHRQQREGEIDKQTQTEAKSFLI